MVFQIRERARVNVTTPMVLWALAMTVILFMEVVAPSSGVTATGFGISALLGIYLGWRRRVAAAMMAPLVSWFFAWSPMVIACMIHYGILKGVLLGLLTVTFGWIGIGFLEFACVGVVALLVRSLRGTPRDPDVVIIDPGERS